MYKRMLSSAVAVASLAVAIPALAADATQEQTKRAEQVQKSVLDECHPKCCVQIGAEQESRPADPLVDAGG
jgi:Ni/Co efflux regulator RcnB